MHHYQGNNFNVFTQRIINNLNISEYRNKINKNRYAKFVPNTEQVDKFHRLFHDKWQPVQIPKSTSNEISAMISNLLRNSVYFHRFSCLLSRTIPQAAKIWKSSCSFKYPSQKTTQHECRQNAFSTQRATNEWLNCPYVIKLWRTSPCLIKRTKFCFARAEFT